MGNIAQYFEETYNLRLNGEACIAELLQRSVHAVHIKVMGRDIDTGIPQCILLPSDEIHSAAQRIT